MKKAALPPIKAFRGIFKKSVHACGVDRFFVVNEHDAKAIVDAVENSHYHRAARIVKRQPWYSDLAKATDRP